jgi:ABC-type uncharacterized transport system ATPase subunit
MDTEARVHDVEVEDAVLNIEGVNGSSFVRSTSKTTGFSIRHCAVPGVLGVAWSQQPYFVSMLGGLKPSENGEIPLSSKPPIVIAYKSYTQPFLCKSETLQMSIPKINFKSTSPSKSPKISTPSHQAVP